MRSSRSRDIMLENCTNIASLIVCECATLCRCESTDFYCNEYSGDLQRQVFNANLYISYMTRTKHYSSQDFLDRIPSVAQLNHRLLSLVQELYE
jgi:hypothetical protein